MYPNGVQSYRRTKVITADPGRLVLMCYEGVIDNLKIAKQKSAEGNFESKYNAIEKAQNIIDELLCSLDFDRGGTIARNLESLYNYMKRRILQADVNGDIGAVDEVIGMMRELLAAWEEVFAQQGKKTQPESVRFEQNQTPQASGYVSL